MRAVKITTLANVVVGERTAVRAAAAMVLQGSDFADALHHALSEGCKDLATLDADLIRRAGHTGASGYKRLAFPPLFEGDVSRARILFGG